MINEVLPETFGASFNFESQKKNGVCVAQLTDWVKKFVEYYQIKLELEPLKKQEL
jgi:hypothetical protein